MSRTVVVFSLETWDTVWRRNQYVVDGLLRLDPDLRVVFVEPPSDVLHAVVSRRRARLGAGLRTVDGYGGRLRTWQGTKWLPRVAGPIADILLRRSVRRALRTSGFDDAILWFNDPNWARLASGAPQPSLYDMTDDWTMAVRAERHRSRIAQNDALLLASCTSVVVCSQGLLESRRGVRPDAVLIPNAVDVSRYRLPVARPADLPADPIALYVGTLHEDRLDVDLVVATARRLRESGGRVVLVGPVALSPENVAALEAEPGVVVLGPRSFETVPAYLQHATALLVPHVVDDFTDSLDPIKLYEYLAVGRPVVTTPVAGFRDLAREPGVIVAERDAFPTEVAELCARPLGTVLRDGVPDWSERVAAFHGILTRMDREGHPPAARTAALKA